MFLVEVLSCRNACLLSYEMESLRSLAVPCFSVALWCSCYIERTFYLIAKQERSAHSSPLMLPLQTLIA